MRTRSISTVLLLALVLTTACAGDMPNAASNPPASTQPTASVLIPDVATSPEPALHPEVDVATMSPPASFNATETLGRPTDHSVTVNVVPGEDIEAFFEYGIEPGGYIGSTPVQFCTAGEPVESVMDGLSPDTEYIYRMRYRRPGTDGFAAGDERRFHTWRPQGATFTFDIQADSHLDGKVIPELYRQTLSNILFDSPDFLIDLGDTSMSGKLAQTEEQVIDRSLLQRQFFGSACHSVPLFLTIGNHDGEEGWLRDGTSSNMAVWSTHARQRYYLNPTPDDFYSGDSTPQEYVGLRESYYAWDWGNALFVVLDPYWNTTSKPGKPEDCWAWTLGKEQYDWLADVLRDSRATFKFVFIHHLTGGVDSIARGGVEAAPYFEWGGSNADGTPGFAAHRPGWDKPIHDLLVETGVTAVFHGHDHLFAHQELDSIVYQDVPQPGTPPNGKGSPGSDYGYLQGDMLSSPGYLRVTVSPERVQVDYIHSALAGNMNGAMDNGEIAYSYAISRALPVTADSDAA